MKPLEQFTFYFEDKFTAKFIKDYLEHLFQNAINSWANNQTYYIIKGYGDIKNKTIQLNQSKIDGKQNLVFVDADIDYSEREKFLTEFQQTDGVQFDYFIFPNPNEPGEIEHLIYETATKSEVKECFVIYEDCLSKKSYHLPDIKGKLYAYHQAFINLKERSLLMNDEHRDYKGGLYNLDGKEFEALRNFLLKHLS